MAKISKMHWEEFHHVPSVRVLPQHAPTVQQSTEVNMPRHRDTGNIKGTAFVEMKTEEAFQQVHQIIIVGHSWDIHGTFNHIQYTSEVHRGTVCGWILELN